MFVSLFKISLNKNNRDMKKSILALLTLTTNIIWSQTTTEISLQPSYEKQVYYSLENGIEATVDLASWDLAFETSAFGSNIRFNGATGSELYVYNQGTVADWATIDTTGLHTQSSLYDSDTSWYSTAFNQELVNEFDLGWGQYSVITHIVSGDSIYIFKTIDESYKKFYIDRLQSGVYHLIYSDLDGSNEVTTEISKSEYVTKNFVYFSFDTNEVIDLEPESNTWDLVFTKYIATLDGGIQYGVTGVLLNNGVEAGKVTDGSTINQVKESTHTYEMNSNISSIGFDWKTFQFSTFTYSIADSLIFVIKDQNDMLWNLELLSFAGSTSGDLSFNTIKQDDVTGIFNSNSNNNTMSIYPNPVQAGETIHIEIPKEGTEYRIYNQQGDILFISNEKSILEAKTSLLESGTYLITVQTNSESMTQRLMIY